MSTKCSANGDQNSSSSSFFLSIVGDLKSPKAIQYEYNIYVEHIKGKVNFLFFAFFMTQHNLLRSIFKDLNT